MKPLFPLFPLLPLFPLFLLPLLLSGCFYGEPPITRTGANTFFCKVNGEAWVPKGNQWVGGPVQSMNYYGNLFTLSATRSYDPPDGSRNYQPSNAVFQSIGFTLEGPIESGTYTLTNRKPFDPNATRVAGVGELRDIMTGCEFVTDSLQPGTLSLEILPGGIIAGTFEFTVFTPGCDTIRVTDGRFDFSY